MIAVRASWLAVALVTAACTEDLTELVAVVESDLRVPDEIDRVVVIADATAIGGQVHTREADLTGEDALALPLTLGFVHSGDGQLGPLHLSATAWHEGAEVVVRRADVSFVANETRIVVLALSRTCFGVVCPDGQTCMDGACRSVVVDPRELDPPGTDAGPGECSCARPNATTACAGGVCTITGCEPLFADCDRLPDNGCETPIDTLTDCGGCGVVCSLAGAVETCSGGTCAVTSCEAGYGDCDRSPANGCERSLTTTSDCGACGTPCTRAHATATCATGSCRIAACDSRHSNPDGIDENGCEFMGCDATRCACMRTCSDSGGDCACTAGCPCTFSCEDDCRASCTGTGTRCTVGAREVSNLGFDCSSGASCTIDARDASNALGIRCETSATCDVECMNASNCAVECRSGASCSVRCHRSENCGFSACEGGEMSCPGSVVVCNRPCP
jgi:hypothetical protein